MRLTVLLPILLILNGCNTKRAPAETTELRRDGQPTIYNVPNEDQEMQAAIRASRASLPTFLRVLQRQDSATTDFAVKVHYDDGPYPEHIWVSELEYDRGELRGTISNVPEYTKQVQAGERVLIDTSKISDWKYVQNGRLVGGTTLKLLRSRLPVDERAKLDESVDYKIQ